MKIISFINERQVIKKILEHLKLLEKPERQRLPPRAGPKPPIKQEELCQDSSRFDDAQYECFSGVKHEHFDRVQYRHFDDGLPGYEEPISPMIDIFFQSDARLNSRFREWPCSLCSAKSLAIQ